MRFGITVHPNEIETAVKAGYDYVELAVSDITGLDENGYYAMTDAMDEGNIRAEVLYGILPDDTPILGPAVSSRAIGDAMSQTLELARLLGADTLIFDCPALRKIPIGFDPAEAWRQLGNFARRLQGWAAVEKINISLLPMRRSSCDLMRYISEAAMIPSLLSLDHVGVAASLYHMSMEAESPYELRNFRSLLRHVRISNTLGNHPPRSDDGMDYGRPLKILRDCGYEGRITIEGEFTDMQTQAAEALKVVKNAFIAG